MARILARWTSAATLIPVLVTGSATDARGQSAEHPPPAVSLAVRCSDARLCALLEDGRAGSPILDALLNQLVRLNGLVYIVWTPTLAPPLEAALLHRIQSTPDGFTCLWIVVHRRNHVARALIPILAHELQHAIEVLESGAATSAEIEARFRSVAEHGRAHETEAAQQVQERVAGELRRR
jgi:hypothetical protein